MNMMEILIRIFIFIFGSCVGSFLNVCIVRLPKEESIVKPRSHCVFCKKQIPWYDNIPLISYLVLGSRCRFCRGKISIRYFIVELLTAGLFLVFYLHFGLKWVLVPYFVFLSGLIIATFIDFELRIIPDVISIGGTVVGLVLSIFFLELHGVKAGPEFSLMPHLISFGYSFLGAMVGGGSIYAMGVLGEFLFKKEAMGGGDVKFMAMIGAFIGWQYVLLTFFLSPFFGAIYGLVEKVRVKESAIAYGPFLALGSIISLFWGNQILAWVLRGYGMH